MARFTLFIAGLLFGVGLVVAGMTQPAKIVGFLDFSGQWDPSLLFVMGGAIGVHAVAYRLTTKRSSPLLAPKFLVPTSRTIDARLVLGAIVFGVGWGLGGYCPGPGLTALGSFSSSAGLFVVGLIAGHFAFAAFARTQRNAAAPAPTPATAQGS